MTIQVFIEGEDHADIVRQLKGLAEAFGVVSKPVDTPTLDSDKFYEAVGWVHADCCAALDRGDDPRQMEVPDMLVRCKHDLGIEPKFGGLPGRNSVDTPDNDKPKKEPPASIARGIPNPTKKTIALAEELGVDLDQVQGSGKDGRVTQVDVKEYAKKQEATTGAEPEPPEEPAKVPPTDPFSDGETIEPTKDNATAALRVVHGEKGMDACMKVLSALGANRVSEVSEEHYPAFLVACAETLGVDTAGLKQQIDGLAA